MYQDARTLGLKHMQLSEAASSSGPPDAASIVHNGKEELPVITKMPTNQLINQRDNEGHLLVCLAISAFN